MKTSQQPIVLLLTPMRQALHHLLRHPQRILVMMMSTAVLAGCAQSTPAPQWKLRASSALAAYTERSLSGDIRAAQAEFQRATEALSRTGDPGLMAQAELIRCAVLLASLDTDTCSGLVLGNAFVSEHEHAYLVYLNTAAGQGFLAPSGATDLDRLAAQASRLPVQHQAIARFLMRPASEDVKQAEPLRLLRSMEDPLARLIASVVLLRSSRAGPDVIALAVDTASAQGWRSPLIAWLRVQQSVAQRSGDQALYAQSTERLRIALQLPATPQ